MPRKASNVEAKIEEFDRVIAYHEAAIAKIQGKKDALLNPTKKMTSKELMNAIKAAGLTPEEVLEKIKR